MRARDGLLRRAGGCVARVLLGPSREPADVARRAAPVVLVAAAALWMVTPLVRDTPLSHDHPVHLFNAWHFWTEMLGRGRIHGWSPFCAFGYPPGEFMPFGPDLWVASFRVATLGLLSWMKTYGLALAGVLVFATFSIYVFARRFFGAATAALAAMLFIADPGAWAEGGWEWYVTFGVWPVTLAMSFTLLALTRLEDVLTRGRRRDVVWCAVFVLASLVTHLLPLVVYPVAVVLLLLDHVLRRGGLPRGGLARAAAALALGVGLASFQIVPMLSRSGMTRDLGVAGIPLAGLDCPAMAVAAAFSTSRLRLADVPKHPSSPRRRAPHDRW